MNPGKGAQGDLGVPGLGMKCPAGLGDKEGFPGQRSRVKAGGGAPVRVCGGEEPPEKSV